MNEPGTSSDGDAPMMKWQSLLAMLGLGWLGVASLALVPWGEMMPQLAEVPVIFLLIQPAVLVTAFTLVGWWAAPKAGLEAPVIAGDAPPASLVGVILPALIAGAIVAAILLYYGQWSAGRVEIEAAGARLPLVTRLLYGGIAEEIIVRWGILSAIMLGALKAKLPRMGAFWTANVVSAFLFGLGHLGALFGLVPDPGAAMIAAVIGGNMVPGMIFGWLYYRHGLEAAILAHMAAHALAVLFAASGIFA